MTLITAETGAGADAPAAAAPGPHPFDAAIALVPDGEHRFLGATHPAWANMVGPFGGIMAAQVVQAVMLHPQRLGEPQALTINFAAAMQDGAFEAIARPVRTNRSSQHWTVELRQQGEAVVTATLVTAVERDTWADDESAAPVVPGPGGQMPRTRRRGVPWLHRYEEYFLQGGFPGAWDGREQRDSLTRMWVRDDPPRPLDHASLAAMADVFFPRIWMRRATRVAIGTVSMTVYFHASAADLRATGSGFLLAQAKGQGFRHGYFDHAGHLWNEAGRLLATTHQLVYYKE